MNDTSAKVDSTHKTPNSDHLKNLMMFLSRCSRTSNYHSTTVAASVIADFADSSDYREKSNAASGGGTSGCGSQSLAPPTSGTGLDLSSSDEWMVL